MGKDSIFKYGWLNPFFFALGAFPVHRGAADREALHTSMAIIESGQSLVMFPEGTRQSGPQVCELFDGTAYVAAKTRTPIVPLGIGGTERAMPKGSNRDGMRNTSLAAYTSGASPASYRRIAAILFV